MPLSPGVRLGPYEILDAIGAGGMGEVYRAKDTRLDRTVAIKILPAHLSSDPLSKQRFEREAKTISSLNHPHICVLYDVGSQDGVDYLVMECFQGKSQLSVASAILEKEPEPISNVKPMTPPALDRAIRRALAKEVERRWQSAADLAGELQWIAEAGSQAGVPAPLVSHRKVR